MALTKEIVSQVEKYYKNRGGFLINISDWEEANKVSGAVGNYCQICSKCLASSPVVSLGEFQESLKDSELFSVGLMDVSDIENCPAVKDFKKC